MDNQYATFLASTLARLGLEKGNLRTVAKQSGVPYPTLTKLTSGAVGDPRVSTVQALHDYFAGLPEQPTLTNRAHVSH
ncbi:hypothetical protein [Caballeronia sp. dw_19]|uniref:hypothetical protein n=1 Tax=Caballeronia sp. dw_19 TaxID=2719791 RepID=UPI001BD4A58A|nr:hypothetical protein [Caballeronia sp. dw_19]